jgi:hypothetical protein
MQYPKKTISFLALVKPSNGHLTTITIRINTRNSNLIEYVLPYPDTIAFEHRPTNYLLQSLD